jgi:hypothetical protein
MTRRRLKPKTEGSCQYFMLCAEPAVTSVPNPVLGDVPTCAKCADKYHRLFK